MNFDITILGGGPAGASAAISLSHKGYSVATLEKSSYSEIRIGETIPPQTSALLGNLKIGNELFHGHLSSNANQSAWGSDVLEENSFFFNPHAHGWHLDRLKFDKQLIDCAAGLGAKIFINSTIKNISQNNSGIWSIDFLHNDQLETIRTRFAIDASGRSSLLVKKQGGKRLNADSLIGLLSFHEKSSEQKQSNYTLVESVENGWWYSADLPENKMVTAFMTDADVFKKEMLHSENFWDANFLKTKFTKLRVGKLATKKFQLYAANSYIMSKIFGNNWIAIGDAAMAYDPLSSAGIHKAIKDGISAAFAIHSFLGGRKNEIKKESENYKRRFIKYLERKTQYYDFEKRWKSSLFWRRRILELEIRLQ